MRVDGVLFDKDGTLFDFKATWNAWALGVISELSQGVSEVEIGIAEVLRFDLLRGAFRADSPVIAGTNREVAELILTVVPKRDLAATEAFLTERAARAPLVPAVPLAPLLDRLRAAGLATGVMTNDTEFGARAHLGAAGVVHLFDFIAGFDSGWGGKPAPEPLWAFASAQGLAPERVAMVGDSRHDLEAGRAAGMVTVGVLTGMAERADLADLADVVLPNIGHLPEFIGI